MSTENHFANFLWIGWVIGTLSWAVAFLINRSAIKKTEQIRAIDSFQRRVRELEDQALSYFVKPGSEVFRYQLTLDIKRIATDALEISKLDVKRYSYPDANISAFRKTITLDIETASRPVSENSPRTKRIMHLSNQLQNSFKKPV